MVFKTGDGKILVDKNDNREGESPLEAGKTRRPTLKKLCEQRARELAKQMEEDLLITLPSLNMKRAIDYVFGDGLKDEPHLKWVLCKYLDIHGSMGWKSEVAMRQIPIMGPFKEAFAAMEMYLQDVKGDNKGEGNED